MNSVPAFESEAERYRAVQARDRHADRSFVYAVVTTGVYCRPSCAARRPLRQNVVYFTTPTQAEAAGYRPCKRCKPRTHDAQQPDELVTRARQWLERAESSPGLDALAQALGLSKSHLHRVFKQTTGMTPHQYVAALRLAKARERLEQGASVTEAIYDAGYSSSSRFYADSPALGLAPSELRRSAAGRTICFTVATSSLGHVLSAATEHGVCWVALGDDPAELERDLRRRFAKARIARDDAAVRALSQMVVAWIERGHSSTSVPLELLGTRFQLRVWQALRALAPGQTITYGQLASQLGLPGAARAVGTACGQNPIAVVVPCHRVVRQDGELGGYRWGIERKRELLRREERGRV